MVLVLPLLALVLLVAPVRAQVRGAAGGQRLGGQGRDQLVTQVLDQFMNQYQRMAALTPEQNDRFRAAVLKNMQARRERQQHERSIWMALENQMRPGVAANPDSVTKLIDAVFAARQTDLDQIKAEQRDYAAYLSPVQRGQLAIQFEMLQNRIEQMIRRRQEARAVGPGNEH
jgi:Mg2+ and Co2+ transporter CorA